MKCCGIVLSIVLLAALVVVPLTAQADQLPKPIEFALLPGVHTLEYAGETLTFTTAVPLSVKFKAVSYTEIQMRFKARPGPGGAGSSTSLSLQIFWEDGGEEIFDGDAPTTAWGELWLSEGGWTEK